MRYGESISMLSASGYATIDHAQLIQGTFIRGGCHRIESSWKLIRLAVVNDGAEGVKPLNRQEHIIAKLVEG
jgi:hypothetical protein